jgi:hypothetical protein
MLVIYRESIVHVHIGRAHFFVLTKTVILLNTCNNLTTEVERALPNVKILRSHTVHVRQAVGKKGSQLAANAQGSNYTAE